MVIALFHNLTKYTFVYDNAFHNSQVLYQNKTWIDKCKENDCFNLLDNKTHRI